MSWWGRVGGADPVPKNPSIVNQWEEGGKAATGGLALARLGSGRAASGHPPGLMLKTSLTLAR